MDMTSITTALSTIEGNVTTVTIAVIGIVLVIKGALWLRRGL